jgi:hypothetical protein
MLAALPLLKAAILVTAAAFLLGFSVNGDGLQHDVTLPPICAHFEPFQPLFQGNSAHEYPSA